MSEGLQFFAAVAFVGAINAGIIVIMPSRINPWSPFVMIHGLLVLFSLSLATDNFGLIHWSADRWLFLLLMLMVFGLYIWLWRREARRRIEEMLEGYRSQRLILDRNRELTKRRD